MPVITQITAQFHLVYEYISIFSTIFVTVKQLLLLPVGSLGKTEALLKQDLFMKERLCSYQTIFFPLKVHKAKMKLAELLPPNQDPRL